jgi:hypothetical protein
MSLRVSCMFVALAVFCLAERSSSAAVNLLVNGDLQATPADVYFDGFDPSVSDDVPGWELFLGAADGSYVLVSDEADSNIDLDMGNGPAGGGLRTAPGSRVPVSPGGLYGASLTYDNYFAPAGAEYYVDWFDGGGTLLSSSGGPLADPNGPFGYAPYTQKLEFAVHAPAGAASAGVRLTSANSGYGGLAADNFSFVPEPSTALLLVLAASALGAARIRRRA